LSTVCEINDLWQRASSYITGVSEPLHSNTTRHRKTGKCSSFCCDYLHFTNYSHLYHRAAPGWTKRVCLWRSGKYIFESN